MARPSIEIDQIQFEKLCGIQCTADEIAGWFGVSDRTLERWCKKTYKKRFVEVFTEKRGVGKISLRRKLFQSNAPAILIFLSKNYLGLSDNPQNYENSSPVNFIVDV